MYFEWIRVREDSVGARAAEETHEKNLIYYERFIVVQRSSIVLRLLSA